MRIPLGAQSPITGMWEKCIAVAAIVIALGIIALVIYPPLVNLIYLGVFILILGIFATCILGLYDSAHETLEAAKKDTPHEGYNL